MLYNNKNTLLFAMISWKWHPNCVYYLLENVIFVHRTLFLSCVHADTCDASSFILICCVVVLSHGFKTICYPFSHSWAPMSLQIPTLTEKVATNTPVKSPGAHVLDSVPRTGCWDTVGISTTILDAACLLFQSVPTSPHLRQHIASSDFTLWSLVGKEWYPNPLYIDLLTYSSYAL